MKFKNLLISLAVSFSLANAINIDVSNLFSGDKGWQLNMPKLSKPTASYYLYSPVDIKFKQLQNLLTNDNQSIYIYRWYQKPSLVKADFNVSIFGLVKITKSSIIYGILKNGKLYAKFNGNGAFSDFNKTMVNLANETDGIQNKNIFINSYVAAFDKIRKNYLYLIMPLNVDVNLNFNFSKNYLNEANSLSDSNSSIFPPPVPNIK
jgi:hypothetical protein